MGILKRIRLTWKSMKTADKIDLIIEAIVGVGSGLASIKIGNKLSEGSNIVEKICIKTATAGAGLAVGTMSAKALEESYGEIAANLIDRARAKTKEAREKAGQEKEAEEAAVNE